MIRLPPLIGSVNEVEIRYYDEIISYYVNKVKALPGVISIIGLGSVTVPGLSDIDILVVVDSDNPPSWEEISIKKITDGMTGSEVVFHDVFVVPQGIADFIEGFFYLDRSTVYYGKQIGGKFSAKQVRLLKKLITFDYSAHRIDSLFSVIKSKSIDLRTIILLISTFRHSYKLLNDLGVISENEARGGINRIEIVRKNIVLQKQISEDIEFNLINGLELLFKSINSLSADFGYKGSRKKTWVLGTKKIVLPSTFSSLNHNLSFSSKIGKRVPSTVYPSEIYEHVQQYKKSLSGLKSEANPTSYDSLKELMKTRAFLVDMHWKFIKKNKNYNKSSGQGYIVLPQSAKVSIKTIAKFVVLRLISFFINIIGSSSYRS